MKERMNRGEKIMYDSSYMNELRFLERLLTLFMDFRTENTHYIIRSMSLINSNSDIWSLIIIFCWCLTCVGQMGRVNWWGVDQVRWGRVGEVGKGWEGLGPSECETVTSFLHIPLSVACYGLLLNGIIPCMLKCIR